MGNKIKQVVIIETDLKMGRGKMAAQAGHAFVIGAERVRKTRPDWYMEWCDSGQKKIVLKVSGLESLHGLKKNAVRAGLPCDEISDAGHTQLDPGTVTCMSIGPAPEGAIDRVTGGLKLL